MFDNIDWNEFFEYSNGFLIWKIRTTNRVKVGQRAGSKSSHGYILINLRKGAKRYPKYAHQIIWEMHYGKMPEGKVIDHINRNRSDNRIENLRCVTQMQNTQNNTGICVYLDPRRLHMQKPWYARVVILGQETCKTFKTKEEAEVWVRSFKEQNCRY